MNIPSLSVHGAYEVQQVWPADGWLHAYGLKLTEDSPISPTRWVATSEKLGVKVIFERLIGWALVWDRVDKYQRVVGFVCDELGLVKLSPDKHGHPEPHDPCLYLGFLREEDRERDTEELLQMAAELLKAAERHRA